MKRALRIIAIVVVVLILIVVIVPFLIPVDKFRPTIEEKASQALGRKVQLGNLSLSLLSGSVTADNLSIGDDPKFSSSPFITAKSLKVGVEIIPLVLHKTLNVTDITIQSPQVTLLHNPAGVWNFSSIGNASAQTEQARAASEQTQAPKSNAPSSASSPSNSGSGTNPNDLSVQKFNLTDGSIIVGSTSSEKRSTYDHVNITASNVSMASKFPVTVAADLPAGGKFKLDGNAGPVDKADAALTPMDAKLNITSLNLASTGFLDASAGLGGIADLDANLFSQNGEAECKGTAKLSKALLVSGGSPASVPATVDFGTKYDLRKSSGILEPSTLKIGNALAHLDGTYETRNDVTTMHLKLDAKDMPAQDLEAFLPAVGVNMPKGASLQGGTMNANFQITGPTNKLVISGDTGLFSAKLAGFDLGSKLTSVASLAGIKTPKDLDIQKVTTNVRVAPDGIKAENFDAVLPALGNLTGAGTVDPKNDLDFKMIATLTKEASSSASASNPAGAAAGVIGGFLGKGGGGANNCNSGLKVPFQIQGTTADPKFIPDVGGLAAGLFKSQLGCIGGSGASGANNAGNPSQDAVKALGGLFKKKKPQP